MHLILTLPDNGLIVPEQASQLLLDATVAGGPDRDFAAVCAVLFDPLGIALDGAVWPAIFDTGENCRWGDASGRRDAAVGCGR